MARFAPVAPIELLTKLKEEGILGTYHLLLAHDVVEPESEDAFYDIFHDMALEKDEQVGSIVNIDKCVILDNSTVELGAPVDIEAMCKAFDIVAPDLVVLPDYLGDFTKTVKSSIDAAAVFLAEDMMPFMWCPQGSTLGELQFSARISLEIPEVTAWGVPRLVTKTLGSRLHFTRWLHDYDPSKQIHLLGFSDDFDDDVKTARLPFVSGIDSNVPIRLGQKGRGLFNLSETGHLPRAEYFKLPASHVLNESVRKNLIDIRTIIQPV